MARFEEDLHTTGQEDYSGESKPNCTKMFVTLLLSPTNGWRKLRNSGVSPADFEQQLFYPILALIAICQFIILFYVPTTPIALVLQKAIVSFVSLFASYFAVLAAAHVVLPPKAAEKASTKFFRVYVAASISCLAFGFMLSLLAPQMAVIFWLGLIYTLYIVCRGVKYLHVPNNERTATNVVCCFMICGFPMVIYAVFYLMLPPV